MAWIAMSNLGLQLGVNMSMAWIAMSNLGLQLGVNMSMAWIAMNDLGLHLDVHISIVAWIAMAIHDWLGIQQNQSVRSETWSWE